MRSLRLESARIQPFWRGIFGIFYIYPLLKAIKGNRATGQSFSATFSAGWLAAGWITAIILGQAAVKVTSPTIFVLVGYGIAALACLFLFPVQKYVNTVISSSPGREPYYKWSGGHWVCLIFGILNWAAVLSWAEYPS